MEKEQKKLLAKNLREANRKLAAARAKQIKNKILSLLNASRHTAKSTGTVFAAGNNKLYSAGNKIQSIFTAAAKPVFTLPLFIVPLFFCFIWFCNLGGYDILSMLTPAHKAVYQFYVCDYSVGFCSRLLVGAVISLFADKVSLSDINLIANVSLIILFALQSVLAGVTLRKSLIEKQPLISILVVLFCLNPLTSQQNMPLHGSLDVFIIILFIVELFIIDKKQLSIITPVICIICLTVHYHFLFSYLPPILALLIYKMFCSEDKKTRRLYAVNFGISSVCSGGLFLYFVFFAKNFLKSTSDEFYNRMSFRFNLSDAEILRFSQLFNGNVLYRDYFDYYIFGEYSGENYYGSTTDFLDFLKNYTVNHTSSSISKTYLGFVAPLMLAFFALWLICFIKEKGVRRLPYAVFMLIPLVLVPELLISTDVWRWVAAALISQFALVFVVSRDKNSALNAVSVSRFFKHPLTWAVLIVAAVIYISGAERFATNMPIF